MQMLTAKEKQKDIQPKKKKKTRNEVGGGKGITPITNQKGRIAVSISGGVPT